MILLNPEEKLHMNRGDCKPVVAAALESQDAKTGITLLGRAVAWGYSQYAYDVRLLRCAVRQPTCWSGSW